MFLAAYGDDAYNIIKVVHILGAIVGFGAVTLNALYGKQASARKGREGLAISEANFLVSGVGEYFIYSVFVTGVLLVLVSGDVWDFGDTWIWLAMLLYIGGIGISHGGLFPRVRKMIALQRELVAMGPPPADAPAGGPPPQVMELEQLGRKVGMLSSVLHVLLVVILVLMVFK